MAPCVIIGERAGQILQSEHQLQATSPLYEPAEDRAFPMPQDRSVGLARCVVLRITAA